MKQLKQFLKRGSIKVGWIDKNTFGTYDDNEIIINKALTMVEVLVHEYLHHKYPKASEREIIGRTARKVNRLSKKEIIRIAKFIDRKEESQ